MQYKLIRVGTKTTRLKKCEACQKPILDFRIERKNSETQKQILCLDCVMARHEQYLTLTAAHKKGAWARFKSLF